MKDCPERIVLGEGYPSFDPHYTAEDIDQIKVLRFVRNGIASLFNENEEGLIPKYRLVMERIGK
ncbi:MAG: hypothetical protein ACHQIM_21690 [Sphingobacteriales bacterium]